MNYGDRIRSNDNIGSINDITSNVYNQSEIKYK